MSDAIDRYLTSTKYDLVQTGRIITLTYGDSLRYDIPIDHVVEICYIDDVCGITLTNGNFYTLTKDVYWVSNKLGVFGIE